MEKNVKACALVAGALGALQHKTNSFEKSEEVSDIYILKNKNMDQDKGSRNESRLQHNSSFHQTSAEARVEPDLNASFALL